jgi:F-type H+-transporting ATPase subunit delta
MRSASRRAVEAVAAKQSEVVTNRLGVDTMTALAGELYSVASLLVTQPRLRRTLGDPATSADKRSEFAGSLLSGQIGDRALEIVRAAVGQRWSSPWDLTDALEQAGDDALFAAAEKDGTLDQVEDELFRFERIMQSEGEISSLLDEQATDPARRIALLDSLIAAKVLPVTLELLRHAVTTDRKRSVTLAIDDLLERATARQARSVARVIAAAPLSDTQQQRLAAALSSLYGRSMSVRTAIDPAVRGGLVVRVADEVIDGSVATRLLQARAAMGA